MSDFFLGEIRMFAGNFAPKSWALCDGQLLSIQQNTALFALLGTFFGGNGVSNFQLPDLRGRLPVGQGQGLGLSPRVIGEVGGTETVGLISGNLPAHNHPLNAATGNATTAVPSSTVLPGTLTTGKFYTVNDGSTPAPTPENLAPGVVSVVGGGLPHNNLMPALCVSFIIALAGIFPSRN